MKITRNMEQLTALLNANYKGVQKVDKDLAEQIAYAGKMFKKDKTKVKRADLVDLVKSAMTALGDAFIDPTGATPVAAEASLKPAAKKVAAKKTEDEAPAKAETTEEETTDTKKSAKKPAAKKSAPVKKQEEKKKPSVVKKEVLVSFPDSLTVGDSTYTKADDLTDLAKIREAIENGETIVFAYYWSKEMLRTTDYFGRLLGQPKSFDNDLDLCTAIYVSDENVVSYQVSMYTEAVYSIIPDDFKTAKDGLKVAGHLYFEVYRETEA